MNLAPIVLFVYNRPLHTQQTLDALLKNDLAQHSDLIVYSDAAKDEKAIESVEEVRKCVNRVKGFRSLKVIERVGNIGLANSIIDGVTKVINEYGRVIVMEDDLVTSPYFLDFMNNALDFYDETKKVWHISGWNYPVKLEDKDSAFLWRTMNCWGWATWKDRWSYFEKDTDMLIKSFSKSDIQKFNLDGCENFWNQVKANHKGRINTWAIYWYATIFQQNGLCLNPRQSYVDNIGVDGSGVNCGQIDLYKTHLNNNKEIHFTSDLIEDTLAVNQVKIFCKSKKKSVISRGKNKLLQLIKKI